MLNTKSVLCLALGVSLTACGGGAEEIGDCSDELSTLAYRGVSLAGAEFGVDPNGNGALPGTFGVNYIYPDSHYVAGYSSPTYFLAKGMSVFRLPFRWERLQPARNAPFDAAELDRLTTTVTGLTTKGVTVILDPHNYARYGTALIGSETVPNGDFADLWARLATTFKGNPKVIFGLMNEPHDMATEQWVSAANAAIGAIRSAGAVNKILVPGNGWSGAASWSASWYGTPNATAMLAIQDPGNNVAFEAHQYLDPDGGGGSATCVSGTIGSERMAPFTAWLRANGKKGFLGEFGASSSPTCLAAIDDLLKHLESNADVYLGWSYWAGGPWWGQSWMAIEPSNGSDMPQMKALLPHLSAAPVAPPASCSDGIKNGGETGVDCGGVCPACASSCAPKSYAASAMTHSVGGAVSGGWSLWSNGYASTNHLFSAGQTTITVKAKGSVAQGVWPHMVVSVGGVAVGSAFISSPSFVSYPFTVAATAGAKEIRVAFDNDFASAGEDRNLVVASVSVSCPGAAVCAPTTCAASGKSCGSIPDGCGNTLACGSCIAPSTCGGAGVPNVCGALPIVPPSGSSIRILPLGDSITLGVNGGYRNGLWTRLTNAGRTVDFVGSALDPFTVAPDKNHEGHPGFSIGDISAKTSAWLTASAPSHVLLMIGTNDVAWWSVKSASQIADANTALIDKILVERPSAWVIVASIPPLSSGVIQPNNVDRATLGKDYNAALKQRVLTRIAAGKHLRFADVYSALTVADLYDGVHPTQLAADKVAQVWYDALLPTLP